MAREPKVRGVFIDGKLFGIDGRKIREQRLREGGMSQLELGRQVGVSRQVVNYWETGSRTPDSQRLDALAKALNCDVSMFAEDPASVRP